MLRAETPTLSSRLLRRSNAADWRQSLALFVGLGLLLGGFNTIVHGSRWLTTTLLLTALVLAVCAVLRATGSPLPWLGGVVAWFLSVVWVFAPETVWVIVPTPSSFGALYDLWVEAGDIIWIEASPVAAAEPIVFLIAASFVALAIVLDQLQLGLHSPTGVGVIFTAIFVVPTAVSGERPNIVLFLAVAATWLFLLRSDWRQRSGQVVSTAVSHGGPTLVVALSALAVSVALPPVLPHVSNIAVSWGKPPPGAFDRGINPILELGQNLRRNSPVTTLEYTTTAARPPYLKVANLFEFSGKSWKPDPVVKFGRIEGAIDLDEDIARAQVTTSISIKSLDSQRMPVPYPATEVEGLKGDWHWEPLGLTLASETDNAKDQTYKVTSLQIEPTLNQMRASRTEISPTLRRYIELPDDVPDSIGAVAGEVTKDATNDYDRAIALQSFFRNGAFDYSETAPVAEGYDGNGLDVIAEFLKEKRGYCVHFSSAMAVMARELGIPSRIAVGYAPGTQDRQSKLGNTIYRTSSDDLHAWPELYFGGIGWVNFEPTPGVGTSTSFENESAPETSAVDPDVAAEEDRGPANRPEDNLLDAAPTAATEDTPSIRPLLAGLAGLFVILLVPFGARSLQRAWCLRRSRRTASRLWVELQRTARDLGMFVTSADTPRAFAAELARWPRIDGEALSGMLHAVERERFGPPGGAVDAIDDFRAVASSLRSGASRTQRVRSMVLPRSIFGQATYAPRPQTA